MLALHLLNHEGSPEAKIENRVDHLEHHLRWAPDFAERAPSGRAPRPVRLHGDLLKLTEEGPDRGTARDGGLSRGEERVGEESVPG